ncbi:MAG TPA: DUF6141 family protein [Pontibacter sp.]
MEILFRERQRFRQVWLWVIVLGIAAMFWAGFIYQVLWDEQLGNRPVSDVQLAIMAALVGVGMPLFFYKMSLTTEVVPGELRVRFWPFHAKPVTINLYEVRDYEQVTYSPIAEYGGWGIRGSMKGNAYNVYGEEGVKLYFYNRKPLLIGSQQAAELYRAITIAKQIKR